MITLETVEELDKLYSVYFSLIDKESECSDLLLAAEDVDQIEAYADETIRFSEQASKVANIIRFIEDGHE